jgi:hypothetical protein
MLRHILKLGTLVGICTSLGACDVRTTVSLGSSGSSRYSHVWVTLAEVWFNTNATAPPADAGWLKFPLSTPVTVDLAQLPNGALTQVATGLKVPLGKYQQVRLLLADSAAPLKSSAQTAGALFNDEVDYLDSSNVLHQVRLELVSPENGVGIAGTVVVPDATNLILSNLGAAPSPASTTSSTANSFTGTVATSTTTNTAASTAATAATPTAATLAIASDLDVTRDVIAFTYNGATGFVLNPHAGATQMLTDAGTIQGVIDVASLPSQSANALANGLLDVEVTAEALSSDGTRRVAVKSAALRSNGSFVLYPLPKLSDAGVANTYDLVIHGAAVQTVIVRAVPVSPGAPATAASVSLSGVALAPTASYTVNVLASSPLTPAGAQVGFYQTLPGNDAAAYLIDASAADTVSGVFDNDFALSAAALQVGTFSATQALTLTSVTPVQGTGAYGVAASAPLFTDAAFGATVAAPAANVTTAVTLSVPALNVISGATPASLTGTLQIARPGAYDRGELIISRDGAIVAATPLDALLGQSSATMSVNGLPGGTASATFAQGVYGAAVWVWNSSDPAGTFNRQSSSTVIDVTQGNASGLEFQIN